MTVSSRCCSRRCRCFYCFRTFFSIQFVYKGLNNSRLLFDILNLFLKKIFLSIEIFFQQTIFHGVFDVCGTETVGHEKNWSIESIIDCVHLTMQLSSNQAFGHLLFTVRSFTLIKPSFLFNNITKCQENPSPCSRRITCEGISLESNCIRLQLIHTHLRKANNKIFIEN